MTASNMVMSNGRCVEHSTNPIFLIYGRSGWIGGLLGAHLTKKGVKFEYGAARLEDRAAILADIDRVS